MPNPPERLRFRWTTDILIGLLPAAATFARYLPGGLVMPFRLIALALIVLAGMRALQCRTEQPTRTLAVTATIACCSVLFGGIAVLRFGRLHAQDGAQALLLVLLAVAVAGLVRHSSTLLALLVGWVGSAAVCAGVGIWEITTGHHLSHNAPATAHAGVIPGWNYIAAFFDNPNLYAYHCVVTLLLMPALFVMIPRYWRLLCIPGAVLITYLLLWTGSRIVLIGLTVGVIVWAARQPITRWLTVVAVTVIGAATWFGAPGTSRVAELISGTLFQATEEGASVWVRIQLAKSAWWMSERSGFLGVGPGGFADWVLRSDNPHPWAELTNPHWGVAEIGAEYGLVTLAAVLAALLICAVTAWRRSSRAGRGWGRQQVLLFTPAALAITWPFVSAAHSTWLQQPLSAAHVATIVAFAAWGESAEQLGAAAKVRNSDVTVGDNPATEPTEEEGQQG